MCRRICAPPELNIRIYDPITSYLTSPHTFNANIALNFSLLTSYDSGTFSGSQILILYSGRLQISRNNSKRSACAMLIIIDSNTLKRINNAYDSNS